MSLDALPSTSEVLKKVFNGEQEVLTHTEIPQEFFTKYIHYARNQLVQFSKEFSEDRLLAHAAKVIEVGIEYSDLVDSFDELFDGGIESQLLKRINYHSTNNLEQSLMTSALKKAISVYTKNGSELQLGSANMTKIQLLERIVFEIQHISETKKFANVSPQLRLVVSETISDLNDFNEADIEGGKYVRNNLIQPKIIRRFAAFKALDEMLTFVETNQDIMQGDFGSISDVIRLDIINSVHSTLQFIPADDKQSLSLSKSIETIDFYLEKKEFILKNYQQNTAQMLEYRYVFNEWQEMIQDTVLPMASYLQKICYGTEADKRKYLAMLAPCIPAITLGTTDIHLSALRANQEFFNRGKAPDISRNSVITFLNIIDAQTNIHQQLVSADQVLETDIAKQPVSTESSINKHNPDVLRQKRKELKKRSYIQDISQLVANPKLFSNQEHFMDSVKKFKSNKDMLKSIFKKLKVMTEWSEQFPNITGDVLIQYVRSNYAKIFPNFEEYSGSYKIPGSDTSLKELHTIRFNDQFRLLFQLDPISKTMKLLAADDPH